jgi:hypothetical protein
MKNAGAVPAFFLPCLFRGHIAMTETLQCLKKHGQRLDLEIAKEMHVPLATVRQHLTALAERREAIVCKTIQFEKGRQFEAWQGRVSGFIPPTAPGRKPKPKGISPKK